MRVCTFVAVSRFTTASIWVKFSTDYIYLKKLFSQYTAKMKVKYYFAVHFILVIVGDKKGYYLLFLLIPTIILLL